MTENATTGLMLDHDRSRAGFRAAAGRTGGLGHWIAVGFAAGSACFLIGPFPGFVQLVGAGADAAVFFAGSIFVTLAALLEVRESTLRLGRWAADPSWWSSAVQFVGTLLFNLSTFEAMRDSLSTEQADRLVWTPDLFGSAAFLVSGALGYRVANKRRHARANREWKMACPRADRCSTSRPPTGPPPWERSASSSAPGCSFRAITPTHRRPALANS